MRQRLIDIYPVAITGIWLESSLYGVYAAVFLACMLLSRRNKLSATGNIKIIAVLAVLFALSTISFLLSFASALLGRSYAVLEGDDPSRTGPYTEKDFRDFNYAYLMQFLMHFIYITKQILADGLLAYRCYVVWASDFRVYILLIILIAACAASGYLESFAELHLIILSWRMSTSDPLLHSLEWTNVRNRDDVYAVVAISMSVVANVIITILTAGRIYVLSRDFESILGHGVGSKYTVLVRMMYDMKPLLAYLFLDLADLCRSIQSGAAFSLSLCVWLTVNAVLYKEVAMFVVFPCVDQIAGIVPTAVAVHMALHMSRLSTENAITLPPISFGSPATSVATASTDRHEEEV
ncbi:hypothetical protein OE88DRAFT_248658 [Heliocybe sulcata]|uniref:Uncharacterized protein n=1 Tax=Heliocybe sulcata TaxID=5364 RepID=A0A5C3MYI3_9AGAM|nr:hypothetical protein OE88DRAFT_248658 [Heliocybe sulcata]